MARLRYPALDPALSALCALGLPMMEIAGGRVIAANAALAALIGADERDLEGEMALMLFVPRCRRSLERHLNADVPPTQSPVPLRLALAHRDGSSVEVQAILIRVGNAQGHEFTMGFRPVSEDSPISGPGGLTLADVNHDLKNIQNNLMSSVRLMDRKVWLNGQEDSFLRCWSILKTSVCRMSRLIQNIAECEFDGHVCPQVTNIGELLRGVVEECRQCAEEQGISLRMIEPDCALQVSLDTQRVHFAVVNLIQNAIEAISDSGVAGGVVEISAGKDGTHAWISVVDNGPGIGAEIREMVFDVSFSTKLSGGTGLGLASVRRVMEAHGGHVVLGQAPRGGARFTLFFPHDDTDPPRQPRWGA